MSDSMAKRGVVSACGFGFSKAVTSIGYLTAMGSVTHSIGFVTELWFMLASEVASVIVAGIVSIRAIRNGRKGVVRQWPAWVAFAVGFVLGASGVMVQFPVMLSAAILGSLYGIASVVFSCTWIEEFARQEPYEASKNMVVGLFIQLVAVMASTVFSQTILSASAVVFMIASAVCYVRSKAYGRDVNVSDSAMNYSVSRMGPRDFTAHFGNPFMCLFVLVGVVGILHTSVLGSSSEHIVGDVSMSLPLGAATLVTAVFVLLAMRLPDPTAVYKACLPIMLVLLSILPFAGRAMGSFAGMAMITCYDVCGMMFLFYIVGTANRYRSESYVLSGVYLGGSNLFLCIGLLIGLALNVASVDYGVSLLTLLAFAAMYPLGIAFVLVVRRGERGEEGAKRVVSSGSPKVSADGGASGEPQGGRRAEEEDLSESQPYEDPAEMVESSASQPDWAGSLEEFAKRYGLTRRESEICSYLVRGRSARHIADELVISENTVWTHVKSVYAKTATSGKDSLIELFESQAH